MNQFKLFTLIIHFMLNSNYNIDFSQFFSQNVKNSF